MNILSAISGLFKPAADLIDNIHTSDEERLKLRNELAKIELEVHKNTTALMTAESQSAHWITAAWRPLCSIALVAIILLDGHFGFVADAKVYDLANMFLGIYGGSRGLEKIAENVSKAIKK